MPPQTITIDFIDLHTKLNVLQDILDSKMDRERAGKLTPVLELLEQLHSELPRKQPKPEGVTDTQHKTNEINEVLRISGEFLTMAIPKDCPYTLLLSPVSMPNVILYLHSGDTVEIIRRMKDFISTYEKSESK